MFLHLPICYNPAPKPELPLHTHNQSVSAISGRIRTGSLWSKRRHVSQSCCHVSLSMLFNQCPPAIFHPPDCLGSVPITAQLQILCWAGNMPHPFWYLITSQGSSCQEDGKTGQAPNTPLSDVLIKLQWANFFTTHWWHYSAAMVQTLRRETAADVWLLVAQRCRMVIASAEDAEQWATTHLSFAKTWDQFEASVRANRILNRTSIQGICICGGETAFYCNPEYVLILVHFITLWRAPLLSKSKSPVHKDRQEPESQAGHQEAGPEAPPKLLPSNPVALIFCVMHRKIPRAKQGMRSLTLLTMVTDWGPSDTTGIEKMNCFWQIFSGEEKKGGGGRTQNCAFLEALWISLEEKKTHSNHT